MPTINTSKLNLSTCASTSSKVDGKTESLQRDPVPSTSKSEQNIEVSGSSLESKVDGNSNGNMKLSESLKSHVVRSFTPMTFHSTPNKESKPLSKTIVDLHLDSNRHSDNVKKTIEVHTDKIRHKSTELSGKEKNVTENVKFNEAFHAKKNNRMNEHEKSPPATVKCNESIGGTSKSQIILVKDDTNKKLNGKNQTKDVIVSSTSKETDEAEIKTGRESVNFEKVDAFIESPQKAIEIVSEPNAIVSKLFLNFREENREIEKPAKSKNELIGSIIKTDTAAVVEVDKNITSHVVEAAIGKLPNVLEIENVLLNKISDTSNAKVSENTSEDIQRSLKVSTEAQPKLIIKVAEPASNENKIENKNEIIKNITKADIPAVVGSDQNITLQKVEAAIDKQVNVSEVENIILNTVSVTSNANLSENTSEAVQRSLKASTEAQPKPIDKVAKPASNENKLLEKLEENKNKVIRSIKKADTAAVGDVDQNITSQNVEAAINKLPNVSEVENILLNAKSVRSNAKLGENESEEIQRSLKANTKSQTKLTNKVAKSDPNKDKKLEKLEANKNEVIEREIKADTPAVVNGDQNITSQKVESAVDKLPNISEGENVILNTISVTSYAELSEDTPEKNQRSSKVNTEVQPKPIDKIPKPTSNENKEIANLAENKNESVRSILRVDTLTVSENVKNITSQELESATIDKLINITEVESVPLNTKSDASNAKLSGNILEEVQSSLKASADILKLPLESYPDVSSTCINLENEESKEESITLYSIDTDESVSLITPSSTTKTSNNKSGLNNNLSEVLTTISNFGADNIRTVRSSINVENPELSLHIVKESMTPAKEEVDRSTKMFVQESYSKLEKTKTTEMGNDNGSKKDAKVISIPVSEMILSTKATSSSAMPKNLVRESDTSATNTYMPKIKPSEVQYKNTEKSTVPQIASGMLRPTTSKSVSKPMGKLAVFSKVPNINPVDNKHSITVLKPSEQANTIPVRAVVKQPEISSTTLVKTAKHESHIPIVSIANKPSSRHISTVVLNAEAKGNVTAKKLPVIKINIKEPIKKPNMEPKPVNDNCAAAVPFGKWTDANRQEFLNKFKEVKAPINTHSKQIKNSNDLNRRDVLQKIDSQRAQTISNATAKAQEKIIVKTESVFSSKIVSPVVETKTLPTSEIVDNEPKNVYMKQENSLKITLLSSVPTSTVTDVNVETFSKPKLITQDQISIDKIEFLTKDQSIVGKSDPNLTHQNSVGKTEDSREQNTASCYMASLIDRTIEDMITRVAPSKTTDELKQSVTKASELDLSANKTIITQEIPKPIVSLDDIEKKMNELHGIPFVERPSHELPIIPMPEIKTYSKLEKAKHLNKDSKITNILIAPKHVKDAESDDEVIEHEPITGDIELKNITVSSKLHYQGIKLSDKEAVLDTDQSKSKVEIITETDFDKFARRNSITYENCLTVNFDHKEQHNVIQTVKEKDLVPKLNLKHDSIRSDVKSKLPHNQIMRHDMHKDKNHGAKKSNITKDSSNKKYQSKIHSAYQSAMTAKQHVSRPISIIEDKPVKVIFLESSMEFVPSQLNVQGQELSPAKKPSLGAGSTASGTDNNSVDSVLLEDSVIMNKRDVVVDENEQQDKTKSKHQRKQVLTPVETSDLELIQPSDIGIEIPTKKKRKLVDVKAKSVAPKKSYLLGRNITKEDKTANDQTVLNNSVKDIKRTEVVPEHKDAASAIDNLVKAAELLENQEETVNKSITSNYETQINTPAKRGRGRPRKYPLPEGEGAVGNKTPSPQKKPRFIDAKPVLQDYFFDEQDYNSSEDEMVRVNWTMGKINENIVCPICNKLFRSENVVFKHVKHCTGVSPNRSDSERRSLRRSRLSQESEDADIDYEMSSNESKKESPKKGRSKENETEAKSPKYDVDKNDVIVIEDTPIKEKSERPIKEKEAAPKKVIKAVSYTNNGLVCEFCGKTFRQQSYLSSHKLQHKKDLKNEKNVADSDKREVFSCEVCKKVFRKLHHLVQHRINHNPDSVPKRTPRKSSSEHSDTKNVKQDAVQQKEDTSAGFRCEPCDKSFRKLHHLVEHRGTHDGINRRRPSASAQPTIEKTLLPPQCEICKKTFRKLHHLIEHKEQHADTSSDKSDDKSIKSALSTKDIIHECSLCYMVFPNEHSLNKHSVMCSKKKRQSKQLKESTANESKEDENTTSEEKDDKEVALSKTVATEIIDNENIPKTQHSKEVITLPVKIIAEIEKPAMTEKKLIIDKEITLETLKEADKTLQEEVRAKSIELQSAPTTEDLAQSLLNKFKENPVLPEKIKKTDLKENKSQDAQKKKNVLKRKNTSSIMPKRPKSIDAPPSTAETNNPTESSDDDEVRYMLNPNFRVDETSEGKTFMKVRARKRNSLQIERPNSDDVAKRRTSLQYPIKIPRLKPKAVEKKLKVAETIPRAADSKSKVPEHNVKSTESKSKAVENKSLLIPPVKLKHLPKLSETEAALSTDSDDSDVKYSFPKTASGVTKPASEFTKGIEKKAPKRTSLAEKRRSIGSIAKRKSLVKAANAKQKANSSAPKPIKKRKYTYFKYYLLLP